MNTAGVEDDFSGTALAPGTRFGNYDIVRKLGEGGMGAVYEARRQGLEKRVALKVLTLGGHPSVTARFVQEARISASLDHPHVAGCFDVGEVEGLPFFALEFLDGETLGARMDRGPMGVAEIVDLALPVCSALCAAHERGIVHRDLKPDNIFLARQAGQVVPKVLDFGIAKARSGGAHNSLTVTSSIMGTPGYMSPEQARDAKHVGPPTDQFALGVILWEAITGHPLYVAESSLDVLMIVVTQQAPPLRAVRPDVDAGFEALVARLLEKDAAARLPSMRAVGFALLPYASPEARARWTGEFSHAALDATQPSLVQGSTPDVVTIRDAPSFPIVTHDTMPTVPAVSGHAPSSRRLRVAFAGAGLLIVLGAAAVWRVTRSATQPDASTPVAAPRTILDSRGGDTPPPPPPPERAPTPRAAAAPTQATATPDDPIAAANMPDRRSRSPHTTRRRPRGGRHRRPVD
jgi:serine/threonine protein kinase